jgi:hypothetical protein
MMTEAEALESLGALIASSKEPMVDATELSGILAAHRLVSVWAANTAYYCGQRVVPTAPNGAIYVCKTSGTSGATEPAWGLPDNSWLTSDGTAVWAYDGPAPAEMWDLRAAARDGWLRKAAACAGDYDFKDSDQAFSRSQRHAHCREMAACFESAVIA